MFENANIGRILSLLGNTADAVALTLKGNAIKGTRNTIRHLNPIVRFVQHHLRMDDYHLHLEQRAPDEPYVLCLTMAESKEETALPRAVQEFLASFNQGAYPELELAVS